MSEAKGKCIIKTYILDDGWARSEDHKLIMLISIIS